MPLGGLIFFLGNQERELNPFKIGIHNFWLRCGMVNIKLSSAASMKKLHGSCKNRMVFRELAPKNYPVAHTFAQLRVFRKKWYRRSQDETFEKKLLWGKEGECMTATKQTIALASLPWAQQAAGRGRGGDRAFGGLRADRVS